MSDKVYVDREQLQAAMKQAYAFRVLLQVLAEKKVLSEDELRLIEDTAEELTKNGMSQLYVEPKN
ncbi:hypothetical protein [Deinococcus hopiensis]|uniref:Uncharacterized protein n=1 Tax=Deinococcus hopiensis KR-140 TaxID=695939 RepID=A0A1W1UV62_9DEIO|nr:hypothetical protein [Deinococcus hopiensis]SMB84604.1 hypothetical protein SAMN00790413_05212 [Deinococcus hopiensis KR-140]